MGTRFELVLDVAEINNSQLRAVGEAIIEEIQWWHAALSAYEPTSTVCELMRRAGTGRLLPIDPRIRSVLAYAEQLRKGTRGAFDLCWQSRTDGADDVIELQQQGAQLSRAGQSLDLGCVGKGLALDGACAILREHRIPRALLHGGTSSILAIGSWSIGVRLRADGPPRRFNLENAQCSVSSTLYRSHLVDPRGNTPRASVAACVVIPLGACAEHRAMWELGEATLAELLSTVLLLTSDATHLPPGAIHVLPE